MSPRPKKPLFSDARGLNMAMQSVPPFDFEGVTMRVFPLRAKVDILQRFVDAYLNIVPREVGYFRAYLPYVFLDLINYGRMSAVAANLGWLSQREIAFSVPLEWYQWDGSRYVFRDWAYLSPFIYVDSDISMTTGREVYGWPKALIRIERDESDWMKDPRRPGRLATVSATVFPEVYAGKREEARPFLEVERTVSPTPYQLPLDYARLLGPWFDVPALLQSGAALMQDWVGLLSGVGVLRDHPGANADTYAAMTRILMNGYRPYDGRPYFNTVNLKQFRSADAPTSICYQALTNARMEITTVNGAGLLGDPQSITGDPSGGMRVLLHRYASEPVVETLGLVVDEEWHGEHTTVASLAPVFPYWMDLDMRYNLPHTEVFRTKVTGWTDAEGRRLPATDVASDGDLPPYNTARGAASQQLGGPFDFADVTLRVLPLLADRGPLRDFCDAYLNVPLAATGMRFEPWGRYVYLVVGSNEGALSESNNVGWWAGRDVTFYVPVKWYETVDGEEVLRTLAIVPVYSYANSTTAAITGSEVSGVPTVRVAIDSPSATWMDDAGPSDASERRLVRMVGELLPVLGEGQRAETREILEIREGLVLPANDEPGWRFVAQGWGQRLKDDLARMRGVAAEQPAEMENARALALEILANGRSLNVLTVKQFRDGDEPLAACYQSLVQIRRRISRVRDLREIESRVFVRIHEYPSQPIARTLGLVAKRICPDGATPVFEIEPVRPFWIKCSLREELAETICRRAGTETWEADPDEKNPAKRPSPYFSGRRSQPAVGPDLARLVDAWVPQRLEPQAEAYRARKGETMTVGDARRAVEAIDPQMILGSVLSREWENWGGPRWWAVKERLTQELTAIEQASLLGDAVAAQIALLEKTYERARASTQRLDAIKAIEDQDLFEKLRAAGRLLQNLEHGHALGSQIVQLSRAVRWDGPPERVWSICDEVIDGGDKKQILETFAYDQMFAVLEEALRTTGWDVHDAPARHDDLCAWLAEHLADDPLKRRALATKADELAIAWFQQARDEARRHLLLNMREPLMFDTFREAVRRAGIDVSRAAANDPDSLLFELWQALRGQPERLVAVADEGVKLAMEGWAWARSAVVHALSKAAQKPDLCFNTDTVQGRERDLFFPASECWNGWYVGPDHGAPPRDEVNGIALPLVNAAQT